MPNRRGAVSVRLADRPVRPASQPAGDAEDFGNLRASGGRGLLPPLARVADQHRCPPPRSIAPACRSGRVGDHPTCALGEVDERAATRNARARVRARSSRISRSGSSSSQPARASALNRRRPVRQHPDPQSSLAGRAIVGTASSNGAAADDRRFPPVREKQCVVELRPGATPAERSRYSRSRFSTRKSSQ